MHMYKTNRWKRHRGQIISLLVFVLVIVGVVMLINQTQSKASLEQMVLLQDALRNAAANCYAIEGRYPPTLDYMIEKYGVVVDYSRFIVNYDAFAENLMPEISVYELGREGVSDAED